MTNEQKLEIIKKALELGEAKIEINYYGHTRKAAMQKANTLSEILDCGAEERSAGSANWFTVDAYDEDIRVTAFYDKS
jgi:hypothetical protein